MLEACKEHKPKLLYLSTYFVYGNQSTLPADEQSPCEPLGLYPATKLCAEHFCKIYSRLHSFHLNICRLTNVYGPGESFDNTKKGAFNFLIRKAQLGEPINVYRGGDYIGRVVVDNVLPDRSTAHVQIKNKSGLEFQAIADQVTQMLEDSDTGRELLSRALAELG